MPQATITELPFPQQGVNTGVEYDQQPPASSPSAVNVRTFDLTGRARGGSRSGLSRWIDAQVSGSNEIQHMNVVVRTDPAALTYDDFTLPSFGYPGAGNGPMGLDFTPLTYDDPGDWPGSGLSGFPGMISLRLTAPDGTTGIGDGVDDLRIVATLRRTLDGPMSGKTLQLATSPAGRDGDGDTAVTNGSGVATFTVTNTHGESVTYTVTYPAEGVSAQNTEVFAWAQYASPASAVIVFTGLAPMVTFNVVPAPAVIVFTAPAPTVSSTARVEYLLTGSVSANATTTGTFDYGAASVAVVNTDSIFAPTAVDITNTELAVWHPVGSTSVWIPFGTTPPDVVDATVAADFATGSHTATLTAAGTIGDGTNMSVDFTLDRLTRYGAAVGSEEEYPGTMDWDTGIFTVSSGDPTAGALVVGSRVAIYKTGASRDAYATTDPVPPVTALSSTTIEFDVADLGFGGSNLAYVRFGVWLAEDLWVDTVHATAPDAGPATDDVTFSL